ncbi:flagellar biosynthesis anti-sigma factor FlgM [Desulfocapsa sp. AH-315-G09]|nr:flagellar biosynthesis anti-sigma factor FlgM [Desulfocapsa sp.]MBN4065080.1 flagellar biosynthesis anti-sigma factor FlgM [Desulfocapsa sp. AH-315-G09]
MSVEFRGVGGLGQIGSINKTGKAQTDSKTDSTRKSDQVQFSSVLQEVNKAQAGTDKNSVRAERVAELKEQVANGSYEPDLNKVASSLLQFLMEDK